MKELKELKRLKRERAISYEVMARDIGVSMRTLWRWLKDENAPSLLATEKIIAYLKTTENHNAR